ncbi:unnamed protein product, partial [Polarella glacialis]
MYRNTSTAHFTSGLADSHVGGSQTSTFWGAVILLTKLRHPDAVKDSVTNCRRAVSLDCNVHSAGCAESRLISGVGGLLIRDGALRQLGQDSAGCGTGSTALHCGDSAAARDLLVKTRVEDEFEKLCRAAVTEARQRCGGRRLVAFLKPLLVDLVKRRQRISSMLNTLRNCGLDKVEKNLLRKHLQARDVLIALAFSSMAPGPSQARMMSLAAKTDSPLPFLFGWALPAAATVPSAGSSGASAGDLRTSGGGLQLCSQIHWGALRELFCSPAHPLVLSLGSSTTLGKSYLLMYLYALQECHFRGAAQPPLRIHSMPSIDLIGDFARE